jgi:hypothetical protein
MFPYFYLGFKLTHNNLVGITREILLLVVFIVLLLLSTIFINAFVTTSCLFVDSEMRWHVTV